MAAPYKVHISPFINNYYIAVSMHFFPIAMMGTRKKKHFFYVCLP